MKTKFDISDFVEVVTEKKVIEELVTRFKIRRKECGITQRELSKRSGVSYGSIRRFETTGEISLNALLKISSVIDCLEDFNKIFQTPIVRNIRGD
ncbi:MAG: helix-turn-helix transcriptional regulator [Acholeplasma sp.]|nr:helix-turn-helix transcriptional regulator [Acholeplasma sp.]